MPGRPSIANDCLPCPAGGVADGWTPAQAIAEMKANGFGDGDAAGTDGWRLVLASSKPTTVAMMAPFEVQKLIDLLPWHEPKLAGGKQLDLVTTLVVALVVVFQSELRRGLMVPGRSRS